MKGKAALLVGAGVGYVLGTRAGRQRYDQIKSAAGRLWQDPRLQETAARVQQKAREQAPKVQESAARAASSVSNPMAGHAAHD